MQLLQELQGTNVADVLLISILERLEALHAPVTERAS